MLIIDIEEKRIERFEPNGMNPPTGFYYNPELLNKSLLNKFNEILPEYKYIAPDKYLPNIGFQMYEVIEENKCKKIGDPNGFCGIWCIWWIYQRLKYPNIEPSILANELIKEMRYKNINFKNHIRNFTKNITDIRDEYLKKYNLDINDWIVGNYDNSILVKLDKDICIKHSLDKL